MKRISVIDAVRRRFPDMSKDEAYAAILCGEIFVNAERERNPQGKVPTNADIFRKVPRFVSRGGTKLDYALAMWDVDVTGKVLLDAGSSAGGFTDCLLQRGAAHVHAVDVGYNQLAYRLRIDPRVSLHERSNIMQVRTLDPPADGAVVDLSFRSLAGAAAHVLSLTREAWAVALLKPQFELGGSHPNFDGVIRNEETLRSVIEGVISRLWTEGAYVRAMLRSPIQGRRGNREYLVFLSDTPLLDRNELLAGLGGLF